MSKRTCVLLESHPRHGSSTQSFLNRTPKITSRLLRNTRFIPQQYDVFAGLDVSKKSIAATFTSHHGFIRSLQMPHSVEYLLNHVRKHFADQRVAFVYEAGPTGYGLYDGLAAH